MYFATLTMAQQASLRQPEYSNNPFYVEEDKDGTAPQGVEGTDDKNNSQTVTEKEE